MQSTSDKLFTWFKKSHMKVNPKKCLPLLSLKIPTESPFGDSSIKYSTKETLLGALIDSALRFDDHISLICAKVSRKTNALGCVTSFISYGKRRLIMKAFIELQFSCCPLI